MPRRNPFNSIRFVENFNAYLDNLNPADLQKLFQTKGNRRLYKKKDFFVRQHAVSRVAGWVESGTFHYLYHDAAGKVHVVGYAFAQEFVCDYASFVQVCASKVSIQALADCVVYELPLAELLAFGKAILRHNRWAEGWLKICTQQLTTVSWTRITVRRFVTRS